MQFIPSQPIATILAENSNSLIAYMKAAHPNCQDIPSRVLDTYIRSTCNINYFLFSDINSRILCHDLPIRNRRSPFR